MQFWMSLVFLPTMLRTTPLHQPHGHTELELLALPAQPRWQMELELLALPAQPRWQMELELLVRPTRARLPAA